MLWNQISQTMVLAGLVCGLVNFFSEIKTRMDVENIAKASGLAAMEPLTWGEWLRRALIQVGTSSVAAFLVPLFLNATSSQLIANMSSKVENYWIFFGFCFLAAFLPNPFISGLSARVLAQKADDKATDAAAKAKSAIDTARDAADIAKTANDKAEAAETKHDETKKTLLSLITSFTEPEEMIGLQRLMNLEEDTGLSPDEKEDTGLSPDEKKVLASFINSRYIWRSRIGLAQDLNLRPEAVQPFLDSLVQKGNLKIDNCPAGERWHLAQP